MQESACAKCFLKLHWIDPTFLDKIRAEDLEKMARELKRGDTVYAMLDAAPDSLPINIDSIFLNQISAERIGGMCWTEYDEKKGLVSVSCAVERTRLLHEPFPTSCAS